MLSTPQTEPIQETATRPRAGALRTTYGRPAALGPDEIDALWTFFAGFARQPRQHWESNLRDYDEVFVGRDADGAIRACGGIKVVEVAYEGRRHALIFTGMTVVDPAYRGSNVIQRAGLRSFLRLRRRAPFMPAYWLFTAATYKPYLLMSRNHATYWPRPSEPWPAREAALVAAAMEAIGDAPVEGKVGVFAADVVYHERGDAEALAASDDPGIRFYVEANPGFGDGELLACLAPLTVRNWITIASRAAFRRKAPKAQKAQKA